MSVLRSFLRFLAHTASWSSKIKENIIYLNLSWKYFTHGWYLTMSINIKMLSRKDFSSRLVIPTNWHNMFLYKSMLHCMCNGVSFSIGFSVSADLQKLLHPGKNKICIINYVHTQTFVTTIYRYVPTLPFCA